jgi:type IV pilus assembly protein PilX
MKIQYRSQINTRQHGAVLVVALLMLLVMTVLGVTAMQMSRSEERMAGNSRDINLAFQSAEAGLRFGEEWLRPISTAPSTCTSAPCNVWLKEYWAADLRNQLESWWSTNGREYGVAGTQEVSDVTRDPRFLVEEIDRLDDSVAESSDYIEDSGRTFYRITASATGASPRASTETPMAVLESTYAKRYN